jgi:hypothetical protein
MPLTKIQSLGITDGTIVNADINASAAIASTKLSGVGFTSGTAVATTSGTAFDFTGIPATAKLIIISFNEVSLTGGNDLFVQLGDSGGFETTGYISTGGYFGASTGYNDHTTAFHITGYDASATFSATFFLTLVDISTNTWVASHSGKANTTLLSVGGGSKSLSDTLTQVRITRNSTNTFDAGKLNILYI